MRETSSTPRCVPCPPSERLFALFDTVYHLINLCRTALRIELIWQVLHQPAPSEPTAVPGGPVNGSSRIPPTSPVRLTTAASCSEQPSPFAHPSYPERVAQHFRDVGVHKQDTGVSRVQIPSYLGSHGGCKRDACILGVIAWFIRLDKRVSLLPLAHTINFRLVNCVLPLYPSFFLDSRVSPFISSLLQGADTEPTNP